MGLGLGLEHARQLGHDAGVLVGDVVGLVWVLDDVEQVGGHLVRVRARARARVRVRVRVS